MHDVRLKRIQKNEVLTLVQHVGLNPVEFDWLEEDSTEYMDGEPFGFRISRLEHRPTQYYCRFGGLRVEISPGPDDMVEYQEHRNDWVVKRDSAHLWLEELRKEVDAPDLWATIGQEKALSTAASSASLDNRPFTAAEQNLIATKLNEIKASVLEGQQFDKEQAETIEREFAYLKQSSGRLGRKDWLNVLYGGLITVIVGVALAPDAARSLLRLAATAFQSLWGMAQGILQ